MRLAIAVVLAGTLLACSPPATTEDADAGSTGVGEIAAEGFDMPREALVGTWSFDRTCASGDGMTLNADNSAGYDEWGQGTWATAAGNRVIVSLERHEPGVGPTGEQVTYHLDVTAPVTGDLVGQLAREDGSEPRAINARRCPSQ
ncbi:MAG: hypothetical protein ACT4OF_02115 [Caulobacteraceae bacterium]